MEIIRSVEKIKRRFKVTTETGEVFWIPYTLFQERPLEQGASFDPDEYDSWLKGKLYRPALQLAVSWLAQRSMAEKEIRDHLLRIGYRDNVAEAVILRLRQEGFLNDAEFARQWAESRSGQRLGAYRITRELRKKGIEPEEIRDALSQIDPEAQLEAAAALAKKGLSRAKADEDKAKTERRTLAMLARRGYSFDLAKKAIRIARSNWNDEED